MGIKNTRTSAGVLTSLVPKVRCIYFKIAVILWTFADSGEHQISGAEVVERIFCIGDLYANQIYI